MRMPHDKKNKCKLICTYKAPKNLIVLGCLVVCSTPFNSWAQTTSVSTPLNHKELLNNIVKEKSSGNLAVLKIAGLLKQSAQITELKKGLTEQVKSTVITAAAGHPEWSSALSTVDFAEAYAAEAKSGLKPQISGGVDYGERSFGANPLTGAKASRYNSTTAQISVKQLIYDGFSRWDSWKSSEKKTIAQTMRSEIQKSELVFKLFESAMMKQRLELQKLWINNFQKQRKDTAEKINRRFEIGSGTIYDIARSDLKISDSLVNLQQVDMQLMNAIEVLKEFNLSSDLTLPTLAEKIQVNELQIESGLEDHPLIKEAISLVESSELEVAAAIAKTKAPVINIELSKTDRAYIGHEQKGGDTSALITLTHNLYTGGSDSAKMAQVLAKSNQSKFELELKKKNLKTTIIRSINDVNNSLQSLELRKNAVDSSIASFAASSKLFELNRGSLIDFQRNEDDLYDKVKQMLDNWFDLSISYYRFLHITNQLTPNLFAPFEPNKNNNLPNL